MTNERELLELAAKAAGIDGEYSERASAIVTEDDYWMPIDDDGDALRLANRLKISVCHTISNVPCAHGTAMACIKPWENKAPISHVRYDGVDDRDSAVRLAIVKAAAEIGRSI